MEGQAQSTCCGVSFRARTFVEAAGMAPLSQLLSCSACTWRRPHVAAVAPGGEGGEMPFWGLSGAGPSGTEGLWGLTGDAHGYCARRHRAPRGRGAPHTASQRGGLSQTPSKGAPRGPKEAGNGPVKARKCNRRCPWWVAEGAAAGAKTAPEKAPYGTRMAQNGPKYGRLWSFLAPLSRGLGVRMPGLLWLCVRARSCRPQDHGAELVRVG